MKIKGFAKSYLVGLILGIIVSGTVSVIATTYFPSNDVTYDNSVSELKSTNVQDAIDELYGVCFPPITSALDKITDLVNTNSNELYKDDHGDIRYYGASPNNYISFNNELWRIIGVIDGKIKIIKDKSIMNSTWAVNTRNNWNNSNLKRYLNGDYYNIIDEEYRNMISEETFYLGSPTGNDRTKLTASDYYDVERSNNVISGNPTSTEQHIGLMYPSDYGYAAGRSCLSTYLYLYGYSGGCKNNNWLFSGINEWLQSPCADDIYGATTLGDDGCIDISYGADEIYLAVRPSLYLNSEVQITGGDGSKENPFQLSL